MGPRLRGWLIKADSVALAARVIARRVARLRLRALLRPTLSPHIRVLHVDCGVHKEGKQIRLMSEWFGGRVDLHFLAFEASPRHHPEALQNLADIPNLEIRQLALVGPDWAEPTIKLFRGPAVDGKADSIYSERGTDYDEVTAARLSAELPADGRFVLRMNIEGGELGVIQDLAAADMLDRVIGFYGMWDDLSKIDPAQDVVLRKLMIEHGIKAVTFNDRDFRHSLRRWAIRLDVETALLAR